MNSLRYLHVDTASVGLLQSLMSQSLWYSYVITCLRQAWLEKGKAPIFVKTAVLSSSAGYTLSPIGEHTRHTDLHDVPGLVRLCKAVY